MIVSVHSSNVSLFFFSSTDLFGQISSKAIIMLPSEAAIGSVLHENGARPRDKGCPFHDFRARFFSTHDFTKHNRMGLLPDPKAATFFLVPHHKICGVKKTGSKLGCCGHTADRDHSSKAWHARQLRGQAVPPKRARDRPHRKRNSDDGSFLAKDDVAMVLSNAWMNPITRMESGATSDNAVEPASQVAAHAMMQQWNASKPTT